MVEPAPEPTPDAPLSPRPGLKRALLWGTGGVLLLALGLAAVAAVRIGPRNLIGMLLYDQRREGRLQVGDEAPDVALVTLDGEGRRTLASHFGDRPVVLIFGSFTWPPFRRSVERLEAMRTRFAGKADFLTIYIKEAHPEDEWQVTSNEKEAICYPQPTTLAERVAIAGDFVEKVEYEIPLLVDPMDDPADEIYAGWPERLYIVDRAGRVAYKGGMGPFDFEPDEVEDWLEATFPDVPPAPATEDGGTES